MSDGSIVISTDLDNKELEKKLRSTTRKIESLEEKLSTQKDARNPLAEKAAQLGVALDEASAKLERLRAVGAQPAAISEQAETVKSLTAQFNVADSALQSMDGKIRTNTAELERQKEKAGGLAQQINEASVGSSRMADAVKRAEKNAHRFSVRMKSVVASALVFTVVSKSLALFRDWVGKVIKTNAEARESIARLKGALLTMAQPLVQVIIPAFTSLVNILTRVVTAIAKVVSWIFGTTYDESKKSAEQLNKETEALDGVGSAAKKAGKSLAAFDEINQLSGGTDSGAQQGAEDGIKALFSELQSAPLKWMSDLELTLDKLRISWNEGSLAQNKDAWIIALSGLLGALIGAAFGGITGAAIGLLLGLAIGLYLSRFSDDAKNPDQTKNNFISILSGILGAVLGKIFTKMLGGGTLIGMALGLSIGLISAEFIKRMTSGKWDSNDTWNAVLLAILGAVIGAMFFGLPGGAIGLNIGLAISIISTDFFNALSDPETSKALFRIFLFGLIGAILGTMFGGPVGAGIGLLLGMSIGFITVDFDKNIASAAKEKATRIFNACMPVILGAILGTMFGGFAGGVLGLTLGLVIGFASVSFDKSGSLSGAGRKFIAPTGAPSAFSAPLPPIPMLARGAVIPPNREFMAVLGDQKSGTNIEAPLSTIEQAVENVMSRRGYSGNGDTTVILEVDGYQFGKATFKAYNRENRRIGVRLVEV